MNLHPVTWSRRGFAAIGVAIAFLLVVCSLTAPAAAAADPRDWTYWRGPYGNGVSYETGLVDDWDPEGGKGSNVAWIRDDLGGRSTPIVMDGRLYIIVRAEPGTHREGEKVVCLDAATGETLWENRFNVYLSDVPDTRVGWSAVVGDPETGNVYVLGVAGPFFCIDGKTGKTIWSVPMHERFGLLSTYGGRTNFPMIADDLVLISGVIIGWGEMARPTDRYIAFDKRTGDVVWIAGTRPLPDDTTYSAAALTVFNGQKAMVFGSGDGAVYAMQPRTGKQLWKCDISMRGLNVAPTVADGVVYMGHSEENYGTTEMGTVMAIDGTATGELTKSESVLWRQDGMMVGRSSPIVIGDRLYCFDDRAKLAILDRKTGEILFDRISLRDRVMRSSPLYADGKLYVLTNNGRWHILKPDEEEGVITISDGAIRGAEFHGSPIASHGRIYLQSSEALYCLADPEKEPGLADVPPQPEEAPVQEDLKPAQLQVVPCEVLMRPGETQKFTTRVFNARGQLLKETEAEYTVDGPGQIASEGTYQAPSGDEHVAVYVTAKAEGLSSRARIRVVPPPPWKFTFDQLSDVPITWVGARYRHVLRPMGDESNKVMVKITTIPKGTRSRAWLGHPDMHDYTIQADVKGARTSDQLPDIGLIAQGCTLVLMGNHQQLEIRTWDAQRDQRVAELVNFPWEEDKWYTMKFRASLEERTDKDGQPHQVAVFYGKVWPRGEAEPESWNVEAVDPVPTPSGSPGLYGDAKVAELYLDNIQVHSNE